MKVGKNFKKFADTTTIHGINDLVSEANVWFGIFWAVIILGSFALMGLQLHRDASYYLSSPTGTNVDRSWDEPTPNLWLCIHRWNVMDLLLESKETKSLTAKARLFAASFISDPGIRKNYYNFYSHLKSPDITVKSAAGTKRYRIEENLVTVEDPSNITDLAPLILDLTNKEEVASLWKELGTNKLVDAEGLAAFAMESIQVGYKYGKKIGFDREETVIKPNTTMRLLDDYVCKVADTSKGSFKKTFFIIYPKGSAGTILIGFFYDPAAIRLSDVTDIEEMLEAVSHYKAEISEDVNIRVNKQSKPCGDKSILQCGINCIESSMMTSYRCSVCFLSTNCSLEQTCEHQNLTSVRLACEQKCVVPSCKEKGIYATLEASTVTDQDYATTINDGKTAGLLTDEEYNLDSKWGQEENRIFGVTIVDASFTSRKAGVIVIEEYFSYPTCNFVASVGGTISLFMGASVLSFMHVFYSCFKAPCNQDVKPSDQEEDTKA